MKATPMIKTGSIVTQTFSEEHVKITELREYLKAAHSKKKELIDKMQSLTAKKEESEKLKNEYEMRNSINKNNYESLLRARNELLKYKCDLKSEYIGVEKTSKALKLRYKNIISSYEAEWQKTLDQYNSSPVVIELFNIQQENTHSEKEIEALLKLVNRTQTEFLELEKNIKQKWIERTIEFAKQMMSYKKHALENEKNKATAAASANTIKSTESADCSSNVKANPIFVLSKQPLESHNKGDLTFLSSIDVSEFDDLCVPKETLENQNEEEMFSMICESINREEKNPKEKIQMTAGEHPVQSKKPKHEHDEKKEKCASKKILINNESKSQYFMTAKQQQQQQEKSLAEVEKSNIWSHEQTTFKNGRDDCSRNKENINFNMRCKASTDVGENEFFRVADEIKFREHFNDSTSTGNFETKNIFGEENRMESRPINISDNEENFEMRYRPASSASSGEVSIAMTADNKENSPGLEQADQNHFTLKSEPEKSGFELFKGFFGSANESHSPTPSIFKLF